MVKNGKPYTVADGYCSSTLTVDDVKYIDRVIKDTIRLSTMPKGGEERDDD